MPRNRFGKYRRSFGARVLNRAELRHAARHEPDADNIPDGETEPIEQGLLAAEQHAALREAFTHLSPRDQKLTALLIQDPPVPYAEISTRLGIPLGSIGPIRRRCLVSAPRQPGFSSAAYRLA